MIGQEKAAFSWLLFLTNHKLLLTMLQFTHMLP